MKYVRDSEMGPVLWLAWATTNTTEMSGEQQHTRWLGSGMVAYGAPRVEGDGVHGHRVWWQKRWLGLRVVIELARSLWRRREEADDKMICACYLSDV